MAETSLNEVRSLATADTASVDLHVENGTITDGSGNPVVLGNIHTGSEQAFGRADAGVKEVKTATPTGDLRVNSNGEVVVDGYGTVTLVGPNREVSVVGGLSGNAATIKTDANGDIFGEYTETITNSIKHQLDKNITSEGSGSIQDTVESPTGTFVSNSWNLTLIDVTPGETQIDATGTVAADVAGTELNSLSFDTPPDSIGFSESRDTDHRGDSKTLRWDITSLGTSDEPDEELGLEFTGTVKAEETKTRTPSISIR